MALFLFLINSALFLSSLVLVFVLFYHFILFPYTKKQQQAFFIKTDNGEPVVASTKVQSLFGDLIPMSKESEGWHKIQMESLKKSQLVLVSFFSRWLCMTNHAKIIQEVHSKPEENYIRERGIGVFQRMVGESILGASGENWKKQHRLLQKAFTPLNISRFFPLMVDSLSDCFAEAELQMKTEGSVNVPSLLGELAIELIVKAGFASNKQETKLIMGYFNDLRPEFSNPFWKLPLYESMNFIPRVRRVNTAFAELERIGNKLLQERKELQKQNNSSTENQQQQQKYLIDLLLEARDDETGTGLTDKELMDNVGVFLFAGSETTANTISWMIHNLLMFPEVYEKLQKEIDEVFPEEVSKLTLQDLNKLQYFNHVMNETMRWTPAVFACPARFMKEDTRVGDFLCKKNGGISANILATHLSNENFEEAERFWPERWEEDKVKGPEVEGESQKSSLKGYQFIPFGAGKRICIGKYFALLEIRVVLGSLLRRYRFSLEASEKVPKSRQVQGPVLIQQGGLQVVFEKRN